MGGKPSGKQKNVIMPNTYATAFARDNFLSGSKSQLSEIDAANHGGFAMRHGSSTGFPVSPRSHASQLKQ